MDNNETKVNMSIMNTSAFYAEMSDGKLVHVYPGRMFSYKGHLPGGNIQCETTSSLWGENELEYPFPQLIVATPNAFQEFK